MAMIVIIFISEFFLSYFADYRNVSVVSRRKNAAVVCDLASSCVSWGIGFLIFVELKNPYLAIPAVIGSALGTYLVASRR